MEGNRLERKERFAGLLHWLDLFLKPLGGGTGAKFTARINEHGSAVRRRKAKDVADKAAVAYVRTSDASADTNNVTSRGDVDAGARPGAGVAAAGGENERVGSNGRVAAAGGVGD